MLLQRERAGAEVGGICCRGRFSQRFSFNNMWGQACMGTRRLLRAREFVIALQGGSLECQSVSQKYSRLVITRLYQCNSHMSPSLTASLGRDNRTYTLTIFRELNISKNPSTSWHAY